MRSFLGACVLATLCLAPAAEAATTVLFDDFVTADVGVPAPVGVTAGLAGPLGLVGGLQSGPVTVSVPGSGYLSIEVADVGFVGDVFEVLLDGLAIGTTSHVPVGGPDNSKASFLIPVAKPGTYNVDLWDYVLSFIGTDSPYGGFVDDTFSPADASLTIAFVPEPATLAVLGAALFGLTLARRSKQRV